MQPSKTEIFCSFIDFKHFLKLMIFLVCFSSVDELVGISCWMLVRSFASLTISHFMEKVNFLFLSIVLNFLVTIAVALNETKGVFFTITVWFWTSL